MTGPSTDDLDRVYRYLVEHITAKKYPPSRADIIQAMGSSKEKGDGRGSDKIQIEAALEALQRVGKIKIGQRVNGCCLYIRLTTVPTVVGTTLEANIIAPSSAARLIAGPNVCIECSNPVCEESKSRCALHFRLAREASERFHHRRGGNPWRPGGLGRPPNGARMPRPALPHAPS